MSKAFFLTRHSATLMEDLARELKTDGALYLIHGDEGLGKTQLLDELARTRLAERTVRWIDLQAGGRGEGALVDSSVLIEKTFAQASAGDVIIADHFEMALKKSRHQLFLSWSTVGLDKNLNLIICSNDGYYDELCQLAEQYQVQVKSFRMEPFSSEETAAFLGFYLFPDRPIGTLSIPPLLTNQLAMARGNVGKIIEIAERAGDQITSAPMNDTESIRKGSRVIVGALVAIALAVGVGWYILGNQARETLTPFEPVAGTRPTGAEAQIETETETETRTSLSAPDSPAAMDAEADEASEGIEDSEQVNADEIAQVTETHGAPQPGVEINAADSEALEMAFAPADEQGDADAPPASTDASPIAQTGPAQPGEAPATDGELAEVGETPAAADPVADADELPASPGRSATEEFLALNAEADDHPAAQGSLMPLTPGSDRLQRDLQASLDWISSRSARTGTLQIMILSQSRFDERVYYAYLEKLAGKGVDVSSVRIFETLTGNQEVFSVVYGEYPSRAAANVARAELDDILLDAGPIVRSVGGLMEEIRRLRARN